MERWKRNTRGSKISLKATVYACNHHPCCLMPPPTTPRKGAGDEVTRIVDSLSTKWGLRFPVRDLNWSPIKNEGRKSIADDVFDRIKYLRFRNRKALDYALSHFEEQAVLKCSNWVPKPRAERDVTPHRMSTRSSSQKDFIKQPTIDEQTAVELMKTLLPLIDQVAELVKRGEDYRIFDKGLLPIIFALSKCLSDLQILFLKFLCQSLNPKYHLRNSPNSANTGDRMSRDFHPKLSRLSNLRHLTSSTQMQTSRVY